MDINVMDIHVRKKSLQCEKFYAILRALRKSTYVDSFEVPKVNRRIYPVSEELKAYGRKKPNGGK
jgi:hypothetical protein